MSSPDLIPTSRLRGSSMLASSDTTSTRGRPVSAVLADIEPQAMAAASIGQVHRATTSEELDYELESANQCRVRRWWRNHPACTRPARRHHVVHPSRPGLRASRGHALRRPEDRGATRGEIGSPRSFTASITRLLPITVLVLGDPHPGNWQSLEDGRVVMFDFGMVRDLPGGPDGCASRGRLAAGGL